MKKALVIIAVLLIVPSVALAATIKGGPTYTLPADDTVEGSLYAAGGTLTIAGTVTGDALVTGGTVNHTGTIEKDLISAGGTLSITGTVGEDVRVAGGQVTISSDIPGDLVVAGGTVVLETDGKVGGDLIIAGGTINVNGEVVGDITGSGGTIKLNSKVGGDTDLRVGELTLQAKAALAGNLTYKGPSEATIEDGAVVTGDTSYTEKDFNFFGSSYLGLVSGVIISWFIGTMMILAAAIVLVVTFKKFARRVAAEATHKFWQKMLIGLVVLIATPIVAGILFASIVGALLGIILIATYVLLLITAAVYAGVIAGSWIFKMAQREKDLQATWLTTIVGVILLQLVTAVPVVGWIVGFIFFLSALGSLFMVKMEQLMMKGKE